MDYLIEPEDEQKVKCQQQRWEVYRSLEHYV